MAFDQVHELSVLTGVQMLVLIESESKLLYMYATPKFEPMITSKDGNSLLRRCQGVAVEQEICRTRPDSKVVKSMVSLVPESSGATVTTLAADGDMTALKRTKQPATDNCYDGEPSSSVVSECEPLMIAVAPESVNATVAKSAADGDATTLKGTKRPPTDNCCVGEPLSSIVSQCEPLVKQSTEIETVMDGPSGDGSGKPNIHQVG